MTTDWLSNIYRVNLVFCESVESRGSTVKILGLIRTKFTKTKQEQNKENKNKVEKK